MRRLIFYSFAFLLILGCTKDDSTNPDYSSGGGCTYNGKTLHVGPKGGCYYINSNSNKTYVDRSYCKCK